jgi:hypothetical protein
MNKQLIKKCVKASLLLLTTMIVSSIAVNAQSLEQRIKVNVPFVFSVGDEEFQAGEYVVERAMPDNGDLIVRLSSFDGKSSTVRVTFPVLSLTLSEKGKLVFTRYGDQYFLSEVWPLSSNTGRGFAKSKHERELAKDYPYEIGATTAKATVVLEVR